MLRDKDGKYDPNGEYGNENFETTFKYSKDARFCLGVALCCRVGFESSVRKRCKAISYTNKKIISKKECDAKVREEIGQVKSLKLRNTNSPWIHTDKSIWEEDDLLLLNQLGGAKKEKLVEMGIDTVGELNSYPKRWHGKLPHGMKIPLEHAAMALPGETSLKIVD